MSTKIEWATETWNPTTGCTKVSPGCANCYIERAAPMRIAGRRFVRGKIPIEVHEDRLNWPMRWREPRRVFVDSMSDLFHEDVPWHLLVQVWGTMALCPQHRFIILTKRPQRMREFVTQFRRVFSVDMWPLPNVVLGVTAENQRMADERVPELLQTDAAVRLVSYEPALGPINLRCLDLGVKRTNGYGRRRVAWDALSGWEFQGNPDKPLRDELSARSSASSQHPALDWVIVGGESGPRRRPFDVAWARAVREQCRAAGVAFFMKQLGGPRAGTPLEELPDDLQIREYPP